MEKRSQRFGVQTGASIRSPHSASFLRIAPPAGHATQNVSSLRGATMKTRSLVLLSFVFLATANLNFLNAQPRNETQPVAQAAEKKTHNSPQDFVVCTGWHALCSASSDCRVNGDRAACDCLRVKESHVVETNSIQDTEVKRQTQIKCTGEHPCDVDQAPVCQAIKSGQYEVQGIKYDWVSTFSYRGWCTLVKVAPKACDPRSPG